MVREVARRLTHVATAPQRRARQALARWRAGQYYGWRRPRWWPARLGPWPGPASPHRNQRVSIFAAGHRYEFAPAVLGPYDGHVHHGTMRPDAADIASRLVRTRRPADAAAILAAVSSFEGGFDAVQTYDRAKFSWGFIQFAATGGLPRLLHDLKTQAPGVFAQCFAPAGIDVDDGRIVIRRDGRHLSGGYAHDRLHDDPSLWPAFLEASRREEVRDLQVANAFDYYYAHPLKTTVRLGRHMVSLESLLAASELGRAMLCDRAVNRGPGHAAVVFRTAIATSGARSADDVPAVLTVVRQMEAADGARLDGLAEAIRRHQLARRA